MAHGLLMRSANRMMNAMASRSAFLSLAIASGALLPGCGLNLDYLTCGQHCSVGSDGSVLVAPRDASVDGSGGSVLDSESDSTLDDASSGASDAAGGIEATDDVVA